MDNRNPVACGVDRDHDIVRRGDPVRGAGTTLLRHRSSGLEGERAAIRHRVARDDRKIENSRHEQVGIDQDKRHFGGPPRINLDVFAQRGPQQTGRVDKQRIDVDGARLRWLAARECEQIRGQAGATGGGLGEISRAQVAEMLGAAEHRSERIP